MSRWIRLLPICTAAALLDSHPLATPRCLAYCPTHGAVHGWLLVWRPPWLASSDWDPRCHGPEQPCAVENANDSENSLHNHGSTWTRVVWNSCRDSPVYAPLPRCGRPCRCGGHRFTFLSPPFRRWLCPKPAVVDPSIGFPALLPPLSRALSSHAHHYRRLAVKTRCRRIGRIVFGTPGWGRAVGRGWWNAINCC